MIEFLAEQLGIPTSNARILYDQWLENALNMLSNGKPVSIEGLGTFSFENDELRFSPQPSLEMDVNRAYAGLEPLPEEKLGPTKLNDTDFDDPFLEMIAPKYLDLNREPESVTPESDTIFVEEPVYEPEPIDVMDTTATEEKQPANLMPWIITTLVLLLLSVGGYFGIGFYESWMESKLTSERSVAIAQDPAIASETPASAETGSGYGLSGTPAVLEGRAYGIIVHSLPLKADSDAQCAKISPLGFRCSVVAAERNGATTYRVAIGQFESTSAAQAAVINLPAEYQTPGNFFISRIQ